jgi:hypothetical protein
MRCPIVAPGAARPQCRGIPGDSAGRAQFFSIFLHTPSRKQRLFYGVHGYRHVMSKWPSRAQQTILGLVVLVAVAHANLAADLTGRAPTTYGMTRLGRDLLRKSIAEPCGRPGHICTFFTDHEGEPTAFLRLPL